MIEQVLEVTLPPSVTDLNYYKWQPSTDLSFSTVYIRFGASLEDFLNVMREMQMSSRASSEEANCYLPAAWAAMAGVKLDWWNPTQETPAEAAAKPFGTNGWIVAKHEGKNVYVIATDTGAVGGTPGPW